MSEEASPNFHESLTQEAITWLHMYESLLNRTDLSINQKKLQLSLEEAIKARLEYQTELYRGLKSLQKASEDEKLFGNQDGSGAASP
jgi:hypothetical protein